MPRFMRGTHINYLCESSHFIRMQWYHGEPLALSWRGRGLNSVAALQ